MYHSHPLQTNTRHHTRSHKTSIKQDLLLILVLVWQQNILHCCPYENVEPDALKEWKINIFFKY